MTPAARTAAEVLADAEAFRAAVRRARDELGALEGVVGVGMGQKSTGGRYGDALAIVVTVRRKRAESEVAPAQRIPATFGGYHTDVVVLQDAWTLGCDDDASRDEIQGGIQVATRARGGDNGFGQGTIACIARRRGDRGRENVRILTCRHVLAAAGARPGDTVFHPYPNIPGRRGTGLGPTEEPWFYENVGHRPAGAPSVQQYFIDCATALVHIDCTCLGSTCTKDQIRYATKIHGLGLGDDTIADVRDVIDDPTILGQRVFKVGRTTGRTTGFVRIVTATSNVKVDPDASDDDEHAPRMPALNLIQIDFDQASGVDGMNCKFNARFGERGDSGSLVVDEQRRAIGMLSFHARVDVLSPAPRAAPSYACHIMPILEQLRLCIVTSTGASRGACAATDGSGVAPKVAAADVATGGGAFHFTGAAAAPPPLAPAERARLLALRDALRETADGRALHDDFGELRREAGYLVRNVRPVTVAWHRSRGPAWMALALNHLRGHLDRMPEAIDGVGREALLARVTAALAAHGSHQMREGLARHAPLLRALASCATVDDALALLRERAAAGVPA